MRDQPNRILEFLTAPPKPDGDACRSNRRRRSSARVELAWQDGPRWMTIKGRLRDISRGGASLLSREAPTANRKVRLRLVEGEGSPWIEAGILEVQCQAHSRHRIRLKFEEPCPSFLLRMAVLDVAEGEAEGEAQASPPEWVGWKSVAAK